MPSARSFIALPSCRSTYFGNWLRDYSQAIDIAALKKTNVQTIINLLMALGFMAFGYVTEEFEITEERLGTCALTSALVHEPPTDELPNQTSPLSTSTTPR